MRVRFDREFEVPLSALETKCYPPGWSGEIDDATAAAAIKAKAAVRLDVSADGEVGDAVETPAAKGKQPKK